MSLTSLERSLQFRRAFKRWRETYELSQQDIHNWGQQAGVPLHNSQIAYLEREDRDFDPKVEFYFSLEAFNKAIKAEGKNGFKYIVKKLTRERLQKAQPFMTHDGRVAELGDFFLMFAGRQPVADLYAKSVQVLDESLVSKFAGQLTKTFVDFSRDNMFTKKEAWDSLVKTKHFKKVTKKHLAFVMDVVRGEMIPTVNQCREIFTTYKGCPCYLAMKEVSNMSMNDLDSLHAQVLAAA